MHRSIARLVALSAFAALTVACSNGTGGSLPFAGPPNNGGGGQGTFQPGGTSTALLRFVQGSPDYGVVDVCVDNQPFGQMVPTVGYGSASFVTYAVTGGVTHTISVYPSLGIHPAGGQNAGDECGTAPGPYFAISPIAVTTLAPGVGGNPARETIVLGGTAASGTLGLYVFGEPSFAVPPSGPEAISHNAAPAFSKATPSKTVGFGYVPAGGTSTDLPGAQSVPAPAISVPSAAPVNGNVQSPIPAIPASFFDGAGVPGGPVAPITTTPAPPATAGQPYVAQLYAIDGPSGGLNLVAVQEQIANYGF